MMHDECMVGIGGTPVHWYPTGTSRWDAILRPSVYKRLALPSVRNYTSYAKYRPAPLRNHGEAKKIRIRTGKTSFASALTRSGPRVAAYMTRPISIGLRLSG